MPRWATAWLDSCRQRDRPHEAAEHPLAGDGVAQLLFLLLLALAAQEEGIAAANPLGERPRRQLMLALYRCGRQSDALEAFQRARRALVEAFGIDPSPELQRLEVAILGQAADLDDVLSASKIMIHPFPNVNVQQRISSLSANASGTVSTDWTVTPQGVDRWSISFCRVSFAISRRVAIASAV